MISAAVGIAGYLLSLGIVVITIIAHYLHIPDEYMQAMSTAILITIVISMMLCVIGFKEHKTILSIGLMNDLILLAIYKFVV